MLNIDHNFETARDISENISKSECFKNIP
ncbi:hypothetical protein NC86S3_1090073 [Escherichia coli]|nr:hypothetical protein HMVEC_850006 [Escherichia coli]SOQ76012.1 hypothetical protein AT4157R_1550226 [Escherichia coli]SOQ91549.1 hypothetical protein NCTC86R_980047 [Escherichia coli]SOQ99851.1 hypothetical protein NC86S3_1090073 [Escherichia coli]